MTWSFGGKEGLNPWHEGTGGVLGGGHTLPGPVVER